jgi:hypothetical protein
VLSNPILQVVSWLGGKVNIFFDLESSFICSVEISIVYLCFKYGIYIELIRF